jgi:type VI secretion system VasD/TssJ family lipoprotein
LKTAATRRRPLGCILALFVGHFGCASAPKPLPACDRTEMVELRLAPMPQLNPDREGYARSVVARIYVLESPDALAHVGFEDLWAQQAGAPAPALAAVVGPDELTLIPGRTETKVFKRPPKATHIAVVAKFREHHPDSGWRALAQLPTPRDPCQDPAGPRLTVELLNYSLRLR